MSGLLQASPAAAQTPYIAEIRLFAGNFAPQGWAFCNGQLLSIAQNSALFSLVGTTFGGNGETTFGLPDLRGRVPVHVGSGPGLPTVQWGQKLGAPTQTLSIAQLPSHRHDSVVSGAVATDTAPGPDSVLGAKQRTKLYVSDETVATDGVALSTSAIEPTGNGQPVSTQPPSLGIHYIIALQGVYPSPQ